MRSNLGLVLCGLAALAGCGGDGNSPPPPAPPPPPPTFTVGGAVSGLTGSVTLANNGGDSRVVSANGAFTFATPVASGAGYAVTITAQPANQTCTVSGGAGTVGAAHVTSVAVSCATNKVTIGGTITGLVGSGLVLRNNGGDDLARTADGAFTFATSIDAGSNYSVTIGTQPTNPTQTCVVSAGAGTATANVTNVAIACQRQAFTVGGTIVGATDTPLVLQLNGASDLTRTVLGAFTFATPVQGGQPYNVTIRTQPASPALPCTVGGGTGTMPDATVTNVVITCPSIPRIVQPPADVSVQAPATATFSAVVNPGYPAGTLQWQISTNLGVTWNDIAGATQDTYTTQATTVADNDTRYRIRAINGFGNATSPPVTLTVSPSAGGAGWSAPLRISDDVGTGEEPRIAVSADGSAMAVWQRTDPVTFAKDVYAARYTTASGWGAPTVLDSETGYALSPAVAMDAAGNALVVWIQEGNISWHVWGRRFTPASGWGAAVLIGDEPGNVDTSSARIVMNSAGKALAIWQASDPSPQTTGYVRIAQYAGSWTPLGSFPSTLGVAGAEIAADPNGHALLANTVFTSLSPLEVDVVAYQCDIDAGFCNSAAVLTDDIPGTRDFDAHPAINAAGDGMVVWRRYDASIGGSHLMANRLLGGGWSSAPTQVDTLGPAVDSAPQVAVDSAGNAIAVWAQLLTTGPGARIGAYASRYDASAGWGTPRALESPLRAADIYPVQKPWVAFSSTGEATLVWQTGFGVVSSAGYKNGAWSNELDIGPGTSGIARDPKVVFDSNGVAIAIWSDTNTAFVRGIYVSRYQ